MTYARRFSLSVPQRAVLAALLSAFIPMLIAAAIANFVADNVHEQGIAEFETLTQESEQALLHRISSYDHALLGGAGFFQGSENVTRAEWREYIDTINLKQNFPGIFGMGWIAPVAEEHVDAFLQEMRDELAPEFAIHPADISPRYVITYVEPQAENQLALGLNIAFEARRKEAAERSLETGMPAITESIYLLQDKNRSSGFLLLHPMKNGSDGRDFRGWIYAPIIAQQFLHQLTKPQGEQFNLRIYDGELENPETLIYRSDAQAGDMVAMPQFRMRKVVEVMQQKWLMVWESTPSFEQRERSDAPLLIMLGGALVGILTGLCVLLAMARRKETVQWIAEERRFGIPLGIFLLAACGSYVMYATLKEREQTYIRSVVAEEANKMQQLVSFQTQEKLRALNRMAMRWKAAGGTPFALWQMDAKNYLSDLKGLKAVEWVDSSFHVRWAEPLSGNEKAIGLNIVFDETRRQALEGAAAREGITITPPMDLVQGYKAFIAYAPVQKNDAFDGFMVGIFAVDEFLQQVLRREASANYAIEVSYNDQVFYRNAEAQAAGGQARWGTTKTIEVYDKQWLLHIVPTNAFVQEKLSALPAMLLALGIIIGALLALTVRYVMLARMKSEYLAESNKLNDAILSSAALLIIATDKDGTIIVFNHAAEQALGYKAEEVIGKQTPALWHDEKEVVDRARELSAKLGEAIEPCFDVFITVATREGVESREWTFIRKDGTRFPVNLTVSPLQSIDGAITGYLGVVEDITERKRQHNALQTSEETFRSAMEHASIGMALVGIDGKWLKVNEALITLLGYTREELLAMDFQSITHPDDLQEDLQHVSGMLAGVIKTYRIEKRYFHKNGRIIWALLNVSLVRDSAGMPNYFISQVQDITEQKEMERIKSEFISVVSHELRTPLTSIRGSLGLIVGTMIKEIPAKAARLIEIAHNNSERLILLINDILDIDKIASGNMRFDMKEELLAELVRQAVEANVAYAEKFGTFIALKPIDAQLRVHVDAARFTQVLSNLLSNAAKFTAQGDTVEVSAQVRGSVVRVCVTDHGPGIAEEFRARIFSKFSQADSSVTRAKGGSGLGLHISKQIVEHMRGQIGFETDMGKGTTFWVEFPLQGAQDNAGAPYGSSHEHRVLVCEADRAVATLMRAMLERSGFAIDVAQDMDEAKRLLKEKTYSAMTLDIQLPAEESLRLIETLRTDAQLAGLPIIAVSAQADEEKHILNGDAVGIVDWLPKPIDETRLVRSLRRAVANASGKPRILHVEDDMDLSNVLAAALHGHAEIITATTLKQAQQLLQNEPFTLMVLDIAMPDGSGLSLLEEIARLEGGALPVLILSASETTDEVRGKVAGALVKSRLSEAHVVDTIIGMIKHYSNLGTAQHDK